MDTKHREVFFNMLLGIQLLYHESFGTELEYKVCHIMMELMWLGKEYNAAEGEIMAISHNASNMIQGKPLLDVDEQIERYKLLDLLGNTEFIKLID
jgi:hypothetical protein